MIEKKKIKVSTAGCIAKPHKGADKKKDKKKNEKKREEKKEKGKKRWREGHFV